ncbi:MAG: hypothetical protein AVDCRST_MAG72-1818 [uncultured Nocardioidaceae bacterium]|uniref:Uncharacterized protein n=1 Tax=uncultured Nocardioidaceae bacterium TaxID=253824 RepID=A0A6J4MF28_9ACTN|nr:MAG: hypothetical protein AVDCRST_MAG72-1818 [uncultured Nocardioidaceae bacterium]
MHGGDHRLGGLLRGQPLDGGAQDAPGAPLSLVLRGPFDVPSGYRRCPFRVGLDVLDQLPARLVGAQTSDAFQDLLAVGLDVEQFRTSSRDLGLGLGEPFRPALQAAGLGVEPGLALAEPVLAALDVLALLVQVVLEVVLVTGVSPSADEDQAQRDEGSYGEGGEEELDLVHRHAPVPLGAKLVGSGVEAGASTPLRTRSFRSSTPCRSSRVSFRRWGRVNVCVLVRSLARCW